MKHTSVLRGLMAPTKNLSDPPRFEGKFGRMFPQLPAAEFAEDSLKTLASKMEADFDAPKDQPDGEESGIPALYTYLGQFVDHDLTFDPASFEQTTRDVDARIDFRTPAFDLDCVYGRGPDDQPYLYSDDKFFLTGPSLQGGSPNTTDVPRNSVGRALIGDPRNDENAIVSQLQGLFHHHHNRILREQPELGFDGARRLVQHRYQHILLYDFLPRIIDAQVLERFKKDGKYARETLGFDRSVMPVEFSGAAYRLGHSMVRPGYRLNDGIRLSIFPVTSKGQADGLTGFRSLNTSWGLDWGRFIDIDLRDYGDEQAPETLPANFKRLQLAYRLDTSLVNPLANLPPSVGGAMPSLIFRNLLRGFKLGLPSGQAVADALQVRKLNDDEIIIGKFTGGLNDAPEGKPIVEITGDKSFAGNCPLWAYILAETLYHREHVSIPVSNSGGVRIATPKLGDVGGHIVASTFLSLLFNDPFSLLRASEEYQASIPACYALKDFVNYALGK